MTPPAPEILSQLEMLDLDSRRPLIISDADEVLLRFMAQLEHFLEKRGLWIDLGNFAINGNIKSLETNEPVEFPDLIDEFFDAETRDIQPTSGAAQSLETLAARAQIIVLTNLPAKNKQERIDNLNAHGMNYPVVVGSGAKGPAVAWLSARISAPVFFLDDIPHNVDSVAEYAPEVRRIHFVADPRLAKLIGPAKGATTRIDVWNEAYDWISRELTQAGY